MVNIAGFYILTLVKIITLENKSKLEKLLSRIFIRNNFSFQNFMVWKNNQVTILLNELNKIITNQT